MSDYPHAKSDAAKMLADGLKTAASERGLSLREIGRRLGYRQPVALSHWATGRTPIPIDRAVEIAGAVGLPRKQFLLAVLEQRHSDVDWSIVTTPGDEFAVQLEDLAGGPSSALNTDQRAIMREVVRDPSPARRWLSVAEIPVIDAVRELRPLVRTEGLSSGDKKALREALHAGEK
jgi:transcriptional regulator with XRE-family HTH domain